MSIMQVKQHTTLKMTSRGFTLVEALIGIAILVMAVLAPLTIAQSGIQGARYAQQQTTATFLAQEGIELAKYQIAYNLNNNAPEWLFGVADPSSTDCSTADCEIVGPRNSGSSGAMFQACSGAEPCKIYTYSNGLYRTGPGTVTPYTRAIRVVETSADREAKITVTISWTGPNGPREYEVEDYAYRWR